MTKTDAVRFAGSVQKLATIMGVSHQAIYKWTEQMPVMRRYQLAAIRPQWFRKLDKEMRAKQ